jgi:PPK2 family polyphosphate:nucleotide phosphotransferase
MNRYRIEPHANVDLNALDPADTDDYKDASESAERTDRLRHKLAKLQERLYAEGKRSLLVVLQGLDASGKDGTIRHVMGGINPQGCTVHSFKQPTHLELAHDFLWRAHQACPAAGAIAIFNRSYYEDVLVTRVSGAVTDSMAHERFAQIGWFEKTLAARGVRIVKFMLHLSQAEQKKRLLARLDDPEKHWKFSASDLDDRSLWAPYQSAFQDMLNATSTAEAPWFVVPADHKWYRNLVVADRLVHALEDMDPQPAQPVGLDWDRLRKSLKEA